jgi:hypothetical protein
MGTKAASLAVALTAVVAAGAWQYAERTRVIEGTWVFMFEGSEFFEHRLPGQECEFYRNQAGWLDYHPQAIDPSFDYERSRSSSGTYRSQNGEWPMNAFEVRFEGRRHLAPWGAGHMGLSKSEYTVDRMLSVKPIPGLNCSVR